MKMNKLFDINVKKRLFEKTIPRVMLPSITLPPAYHDIENVATENRKGLIPTGNCLFLIWQIIN